MNEKSVLTSVSDLLLGWNGPYPITWVELTNIRFLPQKPSDTLKLEPSFSVIIFFVDYLPWPLKSVTKFFFLKLPEHITSLYGYRAFASEVKQSTVSCHLEWTGHIFYN